MGKIMRSGIFIRWVTIVIFTISSIQGFSQKLLSSRPEITFAELKNNFNQPDMIYAPFAFWFWDTKLDTNLVYQMAKEMSEKGLNPGYIHAREGLPADEWLSPLWFKSINTVLHEAKTHDTYMGFCDEYWWPSGRANGQVLMQNPDLRAVSLNWRCIYAKSGEHIKIPSSYFVVAAKMDDGGLNKEEKIQSQSLKIIGTGSAFEWTAPDGLWKIYVFNKYYHEGYDGGDVNYLDTRLAPIFSKIAHKPYQKFEKDFGKNLPGVFVDHEGDYGWKLAWSNDLEQQYIQKKGKDIRFLMPLMIDHDVEGRWVVARYDWFDVVSDIYSHDFLGKISDILSEKGLYTISNLWEENLYFQALNLGDAFKAHRSVTFPGNDCLFQKALKVHDFKEIQSITEFENTRFQSEILGVEGWEMTPITMKKAVNSVICWGASHIVPHGINLNRALDSIPFPADWYTSNPYWQYIDKWTDFTRRASFINSQGFTDADVLLLNPMSSIWSLIGGEIYCDTCEFYESPESLPDKENYNRLRNIDHVYSEIIDQLSKNRVEFLIADEHYLNQMQLLSDSVLHLNNHNFKQLVLPDLFCIKNETAKKILDFASHGGKVYYLGELPTSSTDNGLFDEEFHHLIDQIKKYAKRLDSVDSQFKSHIEFISGEFPMIQLHRIIDGRHFFWLVNNSDNKQIARLNLKSLKGAASIWNCETGAITSLASLEKKNGLSLDVFFNPYEAFWLVIDPQTSANTNKSIEKPILIEELSLTNDWTVNLKPTDQPVQFKGQKSFPQYAEIAVGHKNLSTWESWGLNYFSGFISYQNEIILDLPANYSKVTVDLGSVFYMAEVEVNEIPCGEKLWPPFEFDITSAIKKGESNVIKIKVGNLLVNYMNYLKERNELIADEFYLHTRPANYQPQSGLLGPVSIKIYKN